MFGNTQATQRGPGREVHGRAEAHNGESSPGCRQTQRPWELLYFHLAARACTQPWPEQTLGKTTEWKHCRKRSQQDSFYGSRRRQLLSIDCTDSYTALFLTLSEI